MLSNLFNAIVGWPTWVNAIIFLTIWLSSWYILTWARYYIIEDEEVEGWKSIFELFLPEVMCRLPGGEAYRFAYVERKMDESTDGDFLSDEYLVEEVHDKHLHEEVYFYMRGGHQFFWTREIVLLLFGPAIILIILALLILGLVLEIVGRIRHSRRTPTKYATS